jgi:acyl-coenzyme A thioesterase PaaI-like protein
VRPAATTPDRPAIETRTGRFEFAAHNCFGCGTLNAGGLGLALHVEPGRAWADLAPDRRFEGWEGVIHGGILCTILDEVMAWALVGEDNWGVTARMAMEFRRPIQVGVPIHAEGWITRARRRIVDTAGHIVDAETGAELATATGVYVAADPARKQDLRARYAFRMADGPDDLPPADPTTLRSRTDVSVPARPRPGAGR